MTREIDRVYAAMKDGEWRSLEAIAALSGAPVAAVSARIRDLRKRAFGGHLIERRDHAGRSSEYRLIARERRGPVEFGRPETGKLW